MARYRHLIWDWNGTLLDDAWLCVEILNGLLGRRGLTPVTLAQYERDFCFPVKDYYCSIGFDFDTEPYTDVAAEFMAAYDRRRCECALRTGTREAIAAVAARGVPQSVLSAYEQWRLEEVVAAKGLKDAFVRLMGLDDHLAHNKLENGRRLITELGIRPEEALLIGDTTHDWEVAEAIGLGCALVHSGHMPREKLEATGLKVLSNLEEIPELLS